MIGGTGRKSIPPGIPRTAIIKVQSLLVYIPAISSPVNGSVQSLLDRTHTITKYNKDKKNFDRKIILNSSTREEVTALNQLTLNQCSSAPTLLDYKVALHDEMPGKEIYVSFILMTEVPGISLKQANFWMLLQVERDMIRQAFRRALSEIHACWVVLEGYDSGSLVWCLRENKMYTLHSPHSSVRILQLNCVLTSSNSYFTQFSPSRTYGLTAHLPSRYLHQWHNDWFDLWDLTTKVFVDPRDRVKNPRDIPTKDKDDGSDIAAWEFPYPAAVNGMPVCEPDGDGVVERCVGKKAVEMGELVKQKRKRSFLWMVRKGLGKS